jgi:imidazolonepropionase-like amidohydrolase
VAQSTRIVLTEARLVDGGETRTGVTVVVEEGRIVSAESGGTLPAREDERRINLAGRTILPGMVSAHFHSGFGAFGTGTAAPMLGLEASPSFYGMLAARNARIALECGFTSIIGSSNGGYLDASLKQAIALGLVEGPRVLACSHELMVSGSQEDGENRAWFMELGSHGLARKLDGADAFRKAVREELGRGCDLVKIAVAPGHGASPVEDICYLTSAEIEAVVETAHGLGKKVRAHCPSRKAILACARAGVDIIDHVDRVDAECIEALLKADCTVCPTMLWYARFLELADNWDHEAQPFPIGDGNPETHGETLARLRGVREDYDYTCQMLPQLQQAGVRICVGDDFGTPLMPHGDYVSELELYVKQLAVPACDVLDWATVNGAYAMGLGEELGRVEKGRLADLVVVDGDPLTDIGVLRTPLAVLKEGRWVLDHLTA